jgi:hypothetical protein
VNSKDGDPLNTPPVVTVSTPEQTISLPAPALLTVHASDDGLPKSQPPRVTGGLSVQWSKYRGPGHVTFNPVKVSVKNAAASTTAGFSDPGVYVIQATVDDGSAGFGEYCCWTNVSMTVVVTSGKEQQSIR